MKAICWSLLLVASATVPLVAQTTSAPTLVFNVVVTTIPAIAPVTVPDPPSEGGGSSLPPPDTTPPATDPGSSPPTIPPIGCVTFYLDAVAAVNTVYADLLNTQQLYTSAYAAGGINMNTYQANRNALVKMQLDSQNARDIIRIAAPADSIGVGVGIVSAEIAAIPTLLANVPQLTKPLPPLVTGMQARLANVIRLVNASSCAESSP
ncbi:MAG: hypothetical protein ABI380_13095 [Edaphobacter sp.]